MKKIINEPSNFVEESIEGLIKSHPDIYYHRANALSGYKYFFH